MYDHIKSTLEDALKDAQRLATTTTWGTTASVNTVPNQWLQGGLGSSGTGHGIVATFPWPDTIPPTQSWPPTAPPLALDNAKDLMEQYDHDGVLVKDGKLLFGLHMTKALRSLPLEYIVGLSRACHTLRRALVLEVKRRRIIEKVMPVKT